MRSLHNSEYRNLTSTHSSGLKFAFSPALLFAALCLCLLLSGCQKKDDDIYIFDEEDYIEEAEEEIFDDEEALSEENEEEGEAKNTSEDGEDTVYGMTLYELEDKFTGGYEGTSENDSSIVIGFTSDKKEAFFATENSDSTTIVHAMGLCADEGDGAYSVTDTNTLNIVRFTIGENNDGSIYITTTDAEIFKAEKKGAEAVCMDFMASVLAAPDE